jgi:DsbC/DsbD-like thiol-disulfide interchange protein
MRMLALLLITALASPALAGETPWQDVGAGARARLISSDVLKADGTTIVGLELDMPPTTNTYWRVPGETGIPTTFDFGGSTGVVGHGVLWPYPLVETKSGYVDFVYRGPTVLPVELRLDGGVADLKVGVLMGICSDICVPVNIDFDLPLSFAAPDKAQGLRLAQAIALIPEPWTDLRDPIAWLGYDDKAAALAVRLDPKIDPLSVIADTGDGGQLFGAPQKSPEPNLVLLPLLGGEGGRDLEGKPVRLTFMTEMGPYTLERRIESAGSTEAGD